MNVMFILVRCLFRFSPPFRVSRRAPPDHLKVYKLTRLTLSLPPPLNSHFSSVRAARNASPAVPPPTANPREP